MTEPPTQRFDLDLDEGKIGELLARFRVPMEEARRILDDVALILLTKGERVQASERWFLYTIKLRCVAWWRERRNRIYEVIDRGVLSTVTSPEIADEEREALREDLYRLTGSLTPGCRELLRRRYGLEPEGESEPKAGDEAPAEILRCVAALARRMRVTAD